MAEVVKKVQEHEPGTLIYYAIKVQDKNEIVIIERLVRQISSREYQINMAISSSPSSFCSNPIPLAPSFPPVMPRHNIFPLYESTTFQHRPS